MAEAIGAAILSAIAVEATAVTATIVGSAVLIGGSFALSAIASSLQNDQQKVASQQFATRQPVPPRTRSYGRVKVAGAYVQYRSVGAFVYGLYHGEGPWDGIDQWWLDDVQVTPAGALGGPVPNVPWRNFVGLETHLGEDSQPVSPILARTPGWDATHYLNGCVYSAVISTLPDEKKFKNYYPKQSFPSLRVVGRTAKVRNLADTSQTTDPASWAFSDNAGDCIRDFLTHRWGLRVPASLINDASFRRFRDLCAEAVTAKDGTPRPRYALGGTYNLTDDPIDVLNAMLAACDGRLRLEVDGTIGITGGRFPDPTVTLTDDDVISLQIEAGGSKLATYNRLNITYVSPLHDYQQVEAQPWDDVTAQAESGELLEEDFSRPWVQSFNQVRRLAKIAMGKNNPAFKITGVFKRSAAAALFEESIRFKSDLRGIDMTFIVERPLANLQAGTVTLDLTSISPDAYAFDPQAEEGTPPALPNTNAFDVTPPLPMNVRVMVERRDVSGGTNAVFAILTCDEPAAPEHSLIGRYRPVGTADWLSMVPDSADNRARVISSVLVDGGEYEFEGALAGYGGANQSDWVDATPPSLTASSDVTSPGPVTGFVANGGPGQASYAFTAPNSANFGSASVYRGLTNLLADATVIRSFQGAPSQSFDAIDPRPPGSYYYWVRALNRSGYPSDPNDTSSLAGPIMVTVT